MSNDARLNVSPPGERPAGQLITMTRGLEQQETPPCRSYLRLSCDEDEDRSD